MILKRILTLFVCTGGAFTGAQLPEFSQQYKQRLGGAIDELEVVAERFEQDANSLNLSVPEAIVKLEGASQELFQKRGASMRTHLERYNSLKDQQQRFNQNTGAMRPVALLSGADEQLLEQTWADFEPALPLNSSGSIWAAAGAVALWLGLGLPMSMLGKMFGGGRRARRAKKPVRRSRIERTR